MKRAAANLAAARSHARFVPHGNCRISTSETNGSRGNPAAWSNRPLALQTRWLIAACLSCVIAAGIARADPPVELVIPWDGAQLPPEALSPPAGTVFKLIPNAVTATATAGAAGDVGDPPPYPLQTVARPRGQVPAEYDAAPANQITRLRVAAGRPVPANSVAATDDSLVLGARRGAGLPALAASPPANTVVKIKIVSAPKTAAGLSEPSAADATSQPGVINRILRVPRGGLAEELMTPPPGTVVGLIATSGEVPAADSPTSDSGEEVMVLPYTGGALPPQALDPPPGTIVKLRAP